jgi:hypothetical protein
MNEKKFKKFEKEVLTFLMHLGFKVVGFYVYPYYTDILGYMKLEPPFTVPIRVMVEIVRGKPTEGMVEGFTKLSKDALSERALIFSAVPKTELDQKTASILDKYRIEFLDIKQVREAIAKYAPGILTATEKKKLYDVFSAPMLARNLQDIALQIIPKDISSTVDELGLRPWQVFEQAVFSIFHYCFNFTVRKYGEDSLFEHEPEGVVIAHGNPPYAFIYECKSAKQSYRMTAQDELTYKDYIKKKTDEISALEKVDLKYFVILSPNFAGDIDRRRESIFSETQVLPIFMPANILSIFGLWACGLPNDVKILIDLRNFFSLQESRVSIRSTKHFINVFENRTRRRY